jgi:hypothetical protein
MKALVVYESMFGNTEVIARAVADGLGDAFEVTLADVTTMPSATDTHLLVVGAPTHAFGLSRPGTRQDAARQGTIREGAADAGLREYLDVSPMLTGIAAAAFDTKVDKPFVPGSAAHKAHRRLRRLGCRMLLPAHSFRVTGTTGPLADGEVNQARRWATELAPALLTAQHRV